jgi:DNA-directed RNA polymerase specialized sigma subunit
LVRRIPRDLQELSLRVDRAVSDLTVAMQRQPTIAEISDNVGVGEKAPEASGA